MSIVHHREPSSRLDLNLLRVFDAVARLGHLGRAASHLHLTPSAVSHALARLRAQLDDPLFERHGRGVAPTALARRLAPDVRAALDRLDQALRPDRPFDPARDVQQLRLAMPDELEAYLLPVLHARLRQEAPALRLESVRLDRVRVRDDLAAQRLDLAIDVAPVSDPALDQQVLSRDRHCVVAGAAWKRLDRRRYLEAEHIVVSSRRSGWALEDLGLQAHGVTRRIGLRCQLLDAACQIVAESSLLLTLPSRQAETAVSRHGLQRFPLPLDLPETELRAIWHRGRATQPELQWLLSHLREPAHVG